MSDMSDLEGMFADAPQGAEQHSSQEQETHTDEPELILDDGEQEHVDVEESEVDSDDPVFEIDVGDGNKVSKKHSELLADAASYHNAKASIEEAQTLKAQYEKHNQTIPENEARLGQVLAHYIQQSTALMQSQEPNWDALIQEDPTQYIRVRHAWEAQQNQIMQAQQMQAMINQRQSEADAVVHSARLQEESDKILKAIPEWSDSVKRTSGIKEISSYLESNGLPSALVNTIDSANVLLIARKAMLYDKAITRQQQVQSGVKPVQRVERPGAAQVVNKPAMSRAMAEKAFKAKPSVDSLAAFF